MIDAMLETGTQNRWQVKTSSDGVSGVEALARQLRVHPIVAQMLSLRGMGDPARAKQFLDPKLTDLHDPADLPGAQQAAKLIIKAVRAGQSIVIYGDYDVDGITASAILWHMLKVMGAKVSTYVPHRIDEGYGLNCEAILQIAAKDKPLIISVDCGITAVKQAQTARDAGVDLIITDHHEFDAKALPDAAALVHPRIEAGYPFGDLCGAGVAFKLAWEVARLHCGSDRLPAELRDLLMDLLSFAALGTVADVVPLIDENRIITTYGLGQIKRTRFAGLNAMITTAKLDDEKIDAYHVGFVLGPRLNACGRMGHAGDAVHLLTDANEDEAGRLAEFLTQENDRRRVAERQIVKEAKQMVVDCHYDRDDSRAIVLGNEDWHPGVLGIVASRLVDAFARPVVMLSFDGDEAHGSARSVDGISIHEALIHCEGHLTTFGGHAMAAGLRLDRDKVDAFREQMIEYVNARLSPEDLSPLLPIDAACDLKDVTIELVQQLDRLAPFGRNNPSPVLCVRHVHVAQPPRRVGVNGDHLKFTVTQEKQSTDAIAFGMGHMAGDLSAGTTIDVAFEPKMNEWQGRRTAQLVVKDLKISNRSPVAM